MMIRGGMGALVRRRSIHPSPFSYGLRGPAFCERISVLAGLACRGETSPRSPAPRRAHSSNDGRRDCRKVRSTRTLRSPTAPSAQLTHCEAARQQLAGKAGPQLVPARHSQSAGARSLARPPGQAGRDVTARRPQPTGPNASARPVGVHPVGVHTQALLTFPALKPARTIPAPPRARSWRTPLA